MAGILDFINGENPVAGWIGPVLVAPFIGSFVGVLVARVPAGRGFVADRSRCQACGHGLGAADLVPLASFILLGGRCRYCAAPIPRMTLWAEVAALGVAFWAAAAGERGALLWAGCALGWTLLTLGWIDALCQRLPDFLTLPLVLAGLTEAYLLEPDALTGRALGAAFGYAGFYALALFYKRVRGREGLGRGDAKFLAAGGAWVGAWRLPDLLLVAAVAALAYALRRFRIVPEERIPFGPFLAAGIWVMWLYG
jgi:leader peptidase (prepilin peptidase)/N-methyltransferase